MRELASLVFRDRPALLVTLERLTLDLELDLVLLADAVIGAEVASEPDSLSSSAGNPALILAKRLLAASISAAVGGVLPYPGPAGAESVCPEPAGELSCETEVCGRAIKVVIKETKKMTIRINCRSFSDLPCGKGAESCDTFRQHPR